MSASDTKVVEIFDFSPKGKHAKSGTCALLFFRYINDQSIREQHSSPSQTSHKQREY
jgi:hypothetical protein